MEIAAVLSETKGIVNGLVESLNRISQTPIRMYAHDIAPTAMAMHSDSAVEFGTIDETKEDISTEPPWTKPM